MKMKILRLVAAVAVLSMLAGCVVLSVYPFYTPGDLIFDPGLTGRWVNTASNNEIWRFDDVGGKKRDRRLRAGGWLLRGQRNHRCQKNQHRERKTGHFASYGLQLAP